MRIRKEINTGDAVYEVVSGYAWPVFLFKVFLAALSVYAYFAKSLGLSFSIMIAACGLMFRTRKTESVLAIDGIGIQTTQHGWVRYLTDRDTFFAKHLIQACVINEVFEGFQVNYVIQIIQDGRDDLSQVFPTIRPKLVALQEVWQRINKI